MSEHRDTLSVGVGNSLCRANVMERSGYDTDSRPTLNPYYLFLT